MPQKPKYKNPVWSILVPTVPERVDNFFQSILSNLLEMRGDRDIEILGLLDNRRRSIGSKRNSLLQIAQGEYVSFVDDDDVLGDSYIKECYDALMENRGIDLITFNMMRLDPVGNELLCRHRKSSGEEGCFVEDGSWDGHPTHLMLWRRRLAASFYFPDSSWQEDMHWAKAVLCGVRDRIDIDKVLYTYKMNMESISKAEEGRREDRLGNS